MRALLSMMAIAVLTACTDPRLATYQAKARELGNSSTRGALYAALPPASPPQPRLVAISPLGPVGNESYPLDDQHEVRFALHYSEPLPPAPLPIDEAVPDEPPADPSPAAAPVPEQRLSDRLFGPVTVRKIQRPADRR